MATAELKEALAEQRKTWRLVDKALELCVGDNLLLYGPPGTGKTAAGLRRSIDGVAALVAVTLTYDTPAAELRGHYVPEGTKFKWQHGPAMTAMQTPASRFVVNELHKVGPDAEALFHAICDDRDISLIRLPNGEDISAVPDFTVVGTANEPPEALAEPIRDRFSYRIMVKVPSPEAIESLPADLRDVCLKTSIIDDEQRRISFRQWKAFAKARDTYGFPFRDAARLVWENRADEVVSAYAITSGKTGA